MNAIDHITEAAQRFYHRIEDDITMREIRHRMSTKAELRASVHRLEGFLSAYVVLLQANNDGRAAYMTDVDEAARSLALNLPALRERINKL